MEGYLNKSVRKGFSLIELVVVVAVLSVLSAIAIPSFNCLVRKSRAVVALRIMRQIQNDCLLKKETNNIDSSKADPLAEETKEKEIGTSDTPETPAPEIKEPIKS